MKTKATLDEGVDELLAAIEALPRAGGGDRRLGAQEAGAGAAAARGRGAPARDGPPAPARADAGRPRRARRAAAAARARPVHARPRTSCGGWGSHEGDEDRSPRASPCRASTRRRGLRGAGLPGRGAPRRADARRCAPPSCRSGESHLELLEPTDPSSTIARFLEKRSGLHHVCVAVDDLDAALAEMKARGVPLIDQTPRVGAGGCRVAFVHPKAAAGVLLELKEQKPLAARTPALRSAAAAR